MRRQVENNNLLLLAVGNKLERQMRLVTIKDKQLVFTSPYTSGYKIEVLDPLKGEYIVNIARF